MSRLTVNDIKNIGTSLQKLDDELVNITGKKLKEISAFAVRKESLNFEGLKVAVVPITSGLGIIGGFSDTVCEILKHIGVDAFVTDGTDVTGIHEGIKKANCMFFADDNTFVAVNYASGKISENSEATGLGFASALELASGGIQGKEVLIIGGGKVGCAAADFLYDKGALISIFDIDMEKKFNPEFIRLDEIDKKQFSYIIEASPQIGLISESNATKTAIISAPGVPYELEISFAEKIAESGKIIYNPLEIGVATMMAIIA